MISNSLESNRLDLPRQLCFRVTRFCNARCGFCLAPPDGGVHPSGKVLADRINWLLSHGVRTIHFCGGEPTIHRELPDLIRHVRARGGNSKLTTNGILLSDTLVSTLRATGTAVKVSLHGDENHHDEIVGRKAFRPATKTIQRLLAAGVTTSVQTTIVTGHMDVVSWVVRYCVENRVKSANFLPFIPRGNGYLRQGNYALSQGERARLRNLIKENRRQYHGRLDIRLLDFNAGQIPVVEPDGRVILEGASETLDVQLCQIPVAGSSEEAPLEEHPWSRLQSVTAESAAQIP